MGQFLFGLLSGVVVGLVMEWVIDWTGLLPRKSDTPEGAQRKTTSAAADHEDTRVQVKRAEERQSADNNIDAIGE